MRFKPWGAWGVLGLICALIIGCNTTNRQPDKTLGASSGNPPQGKAIGSTGAPAFGAQNNKPFPTNGGLPNGTQFTNVPGISPAGGAPNYSAPGSGGVNPPQNSGNFTPKNFVPPGGSSTFGNSPGPAPTPNVGQPSVFGSDRSTIAPDSPLPAVKLPGRP